MQDTTKIDGRVNRLGLPIGEFCSVAGFSDSTYYDMPEEQKPRTVLVGKAGSKKPKRIAAETPADYLARLAEIQSKARTAP